MPYVYLLQPAEFINTNCYKIGMTSIDILDRLMSYESNSKYISFFKCSKAKEAEQEMIDKLNQNIDVQLFKEREYFCGALKNIRKVFVEVMNKYVDMEAEDNEEDSDDEDEYEEDDSTVIQIQGNNNTTNNITNSSLNNSMNNVNININIPDSFVKVKDLESYMSEIKEIIKNHLPDCFQKLVLSHMTTKESDSI